MTNILVTQKEYDKAANVFNHPDNNITMIPVESGEQELADKVRHYHAAAVIVGVERYSGPLYQALKETNTSSSLLPETPVAMIARFGVGFDGIDCKLAKKQGIVVTNTPGVLARSVAEQTFWLTGSLLRNIAKGDQAIKKGEFPTFIGTELAGKTILIVGFGEIGRQVARIAQFGFEMNVLTVARTPLSDRADVSVSDSPETWLKKNGINEYSTDLNQMISRADIVSLHLASTAETRHLFSVDRLALMKPTAVLVNTSRGPIIDELALFNALVNRQLAGAALDVFESEPYKPIHPDRDLRTLPNILMTPHLGSSTEEANRRMGERTLRNVRLFLDKKYDELDIVGR